MDKAIHTSRITRRCCSTNFRCAPNLPQSAALYAGNFMEELAKVLSNNDELETWKNHTQGHDKSQVAGAYEEAQKLWLKRMISEQRLFLNPDVIVDIQRQRWKATGLQKRMIWASLIAADESRASKKRMYRIKKSLIAKYDSDWWEDVYSRIKPAFAAKERIKKINSGPAVSKFISITFIGVEAAHMERDSALRMMPKR